MNAPQSPPQSAPLHACFSGALACSGCNPCPACGEAIKDAVLPQAVLTSGFGELATAFYDAVTALDALVTTLRSRGIDPTAHLGVAMPSFPPALRSNEEMAIAFFRGYDRGWKLLHERMQGGDLVNRYVMQPVILPPPAPQASMPPQASTPPEDAANARVAPITSPYERPTTGATGVTITDVPVAPTASAASRTAETVAAPKSAAPSIAQPSAPHVPPLEAHEIARMVAVPAPPGMGASLPVEARNGTTGGHGAGE